MPLVVEQSIANAVDTPSGDSNADLPFGALSLDATGAIAVVGGASLPFGAMSLSAAGLVFSIIASFGTVRGVAAYGSIKGGRR